MQLQRQGGVLPAPPGETPHDKTTLEPNANGAYCDPGQDKCFAPEWAVVNYIEHKFSRSDYVTIRNEYFDDIRGQRAGYKTKYTEHVLMWGHWFGSTVLFRPEIRYVNRINAEALDAILRLFEERGYRFGTLGQAQDDPAFCTEDTLVTRFGPMWGYRWARSLGVKIDGSKESEPPGWVLRYGMASTPR